MSDIVSRPYHPDPQRACPACCFGGREQHAEWCPKHAVCIKLNQPFRLPIQYADAPLTIAQAVLAEREACAKALEGPTVPPEFEGTSMARGLARGIYLRACQENAAKIRARGRA